MPNESDASISRLPSPKQRILKTCIGIVASKIADVNSRGAHGEATKIFLELRQEPEFVGLRINDSYGLEIVHQDGSTVDGRPAGQEHIVALSLISGLQRCAPIRGPIIMDSPFGRLDEDHRNNVVRALTSMADQVVLLVYENELDRQTAIDELQGKLRQELTLERVNARHTSIELRT